MLKLMIMLQLQLLCKVFSWFRCVGASWQVTKMSIRFIKHCQVFRLGTNGMIILRMIAGRQLYERGVKKIIKWLILVSDDSAKADPRIPAK